MDQRKALFRAKLRESQKQEKRIDSPLVRYNENDQPVCKVCNIALKSESLWPAHQVSRKHRETIENLKAAAASLTSDNNADSKQQKETQNSRASSKLPGDFFEKQETKRQKKGNSQTVELSIGSLPQGKKNVCTSVLSESMETISDKSDVNQMEVEEKCKTSTKLGVSSKRIDHADAKQTCLPENFFDNTERTENQPIRLVVEKDNPGVGQPMKDLPDGFFGIEKSDNRDTSHLTHASRTDSFNSGQAKGTLPEGFFDNKDKDLRARGIQPVKVDINDAYKEFEKEIQVNLQEVDDRLEEEEIDAADEMEEYRSLEQKEYKEKVEEVKNKLLEAKAERLARAHRRPTLMGKESSDESSSESDEEGDNGFTVDWRAQHL